MMNSKYFMILTKKPISDFTKYDKIYKLFILFSNCTQNRFTRTKRTKDGIPSQLSYQFFL